MVVFGQSDCNRAKILYSCKVAVFGRSGFIRAKLVVFRQIGYIQVKLVVIGLSGCIWAKVVVFGQKWLYSGKGCCTPVK